MRISLGIVWLDNNGQSWGNLTIGYVAYGFSRHYRNFSTPITLLICWQPLIGHRIRPYVGWQIFNKAPETQIRTRAIKIALSID